MKRSEKDIRKSKWYKNLSDEDKENYEASRQDAWENSLEYHLLMRGR